MKKSVLSEIPKYDEFFNPAFKALKNLGGSCTNEEMEREVIKIMEIPENLADQPHGENRNKTEVQYRLSWARTYLKKYGAIDNSDRGIWYITQKYTDKEVLDPKEIRRLVQKDTKNSEKKEVESESWVQELEHILLNIQPAAFERLSQRLLREYGFDDVIVTGKTNDGGIDGTGKLTLNGIITINVAFQCKRYKGSVSAQEIRNFRGSWTSDIEKGIFITTGRFTTEAKNESEKQGKTTINLIDGEELIKAIARFGLGCKPITTYEIDKEYFDKI